MGLDRAMVHLEGWNLRKKYIFAIWQELCFISIALKCLLMHKIENCTCMLCIKLYYFWVRSAHVSFPSEARNCSSTGIPPLVSPPQLQQAGAYYIFLYVYSKIMYSGWTLCVDITVELWHHTTPTVLHNQILLLWYSENPFWQFQCWWKRNIFQQARPETSICEIFAVTEKGQLHAASSRVNRRGGGIKKCQMEGQWSLTSRLSVSKNGKGNIFWP